MQLFPQRLKQAACKSKNSVYFSKKWPSILEQWVHFTTARFVYNHICLTTTTKKGVKSDCSNDEPLYDRQDLQLKLPDLIMFVNQGLAIMMKLRSARRFLSLAGKTEVEASCSML